jgi:hypothetical protein
MTAILLSRSKILLLLSLLLLAPRVGQAAEDAPLAPVPSTASAVPGTDEGAPLRLLEEPTAQRQRVPMGLRLLAEVGAGLLTSVGGGLVGGFASTGLCEATGFGSTPSFAIIGNCFSAALLGILVGGSLGYPLGVWWGGEVLGGDGSLLASLAGMGTGILMGFLLATAMYQANPNGSHTGIVAGLTIMTGPILAYELSQRREPSLPAPTVASSRPRLQPLLSVFSGGALLGLGGTF